MFHSNKLYKKKLLLLLIPILLVILSSITVLHAESAPEALEAEKTIQETAQETEQESPHIELQMQKTGDMMPADYTGQMRTLYIVGQGFPLEGVLSDTSEGIYIVRQTSSHYRSDNTAYTPREYEDVIKDAAPGTPNLRISQGLTDDIDIEEAANSSVGISFRGTSDEASSAGSGSDGSSSSGSGGKTGDTTPIFWVLIVGLLILGIVFGIVFIKRRRK